MALERVSQRLIGQCGGRVADSNHDASDQVLGPQGVMRAMVGVTLGAGLGMFIALITPRRKHDDG